MTRPNVLILIFALMTFLPSVASASATYDYEYTYPDSYPLHDASERGDVAEVKRLIAAGEGVDVNKRTERDERPYEATGERPLHLASLYGHAEVVKVLLAAGADVDGMEFDFNSAYDYPVTPLYLASENGRAEVVKVLVAAAAVKILKDPGAMEE